MDKRHSKYNIINISIIENRFIGVIVENERFKSLQNQVCNNRRKKRSHRGSKRLLVNCVVKMEEGRIQN